MDPSYGRIYGYIDDAYDQMPDDGLVFCNVMYCHAEKVLRRNTFVELLKAAGAAVLLSLWYLIPFVQYMLGEKLRINSKIAKRCAHRGLLCDVGRFYAGGHKPMQSFYGS